MGFWEELSGGEAPGRDAVVGVGGRLTYDALFRQVEALSRRLPDVGVQPGDRILLMAPDSPDYVVGLLGVLAAGAVAIPVAAAAGRERQRHAATGLGARFGLVHRDCRPACPLPGELRFERTEGAARVTLEAMDEAPPPSERIDEETALVLLSSGSTGAPKGVMLHHEGLSWTARTLAQRFGLTADHRELIVCPLVHSGAWQRVAATLLARGTVVIGDGPVSITALLDDCAKHSIQGFYTPPPLVRYLLKADRDRVRAAMASVNTLEIGSAAIEEAELEALIELLPETEVYLHYGLTECSRACVLDASRTPDRLGTVGRPLPGVEVAIRDVGSGRDAGAGRPGEIWLKGPQAATGYVAAPEPTAATFVDGWVRTGDHGQVDADGYLTFLGRQDDRITSAGFSFYPGEVEAELGEVEGVRDYLVAGVPDPRGVLGDVVWAFVEPADPAGWSSVQWAAAVRRRLPAHMVPRKVVVVDALPRTPSGKGDRRRTVERFARGEAEE